MIDPLVISSRECLHHRPGDEHPEHPCRLEAVLGRVRAAGIAVRQTQRPASPAELLLVHTREYVHAITTGELADLHTDNETIIGKDSETAARWAAGAVIELVDEIMSGTAHCGFALVRPPGHHAHPGRGSGYCIFNNIAIGAAHGLALGAERIAIVDWDVHPGDGTFAVFRDDPRVLTLSVHAANAWPGGASVAASTPNGINIPLPEGAGDQDYAAVLEELILPLLQRHRPTVILVSCGFDAHENDPLSEACVTTHGFGWMTYRLRQIADQICNGRLGLILEGGYDIGSLGACAVACILALTHTPPSASIPTDKPFSDTSTLIAELRRRYGL